MNNKENIVALTNKASIALKQKDYQTTLDAYAQALKIAREEKLFPLTAVILNYIGDTFQAQGKIQDAVIAYEAALEALESQDKLKVESVIDRLSRVSKGFYNNPDPVPDLYSAEVAKTLEAEAKDSALAIKLWLDLGNAYLRQPQEAPALNAYKQALQDPEIANHLLLQAYAIANIGEIYRRQDNLELAETNLQEALQLFDQVNSPLAKRRGLAILASIASDRHQFKKAETLYQQSLSLYEQAEDNLGKGKTSVGLARLYLEQKRFNKAQPIYQQAFKIAQAEQDWETLGHCYWGLGCCYQEAGKLEQAIASFQKALNLIELRQQDLRTDEGKVTFLDSVKDVFDRLLIAHLDLAQRENGNYQAALEVAESARGRALNDLMGGYQRRHPQLKKQEKVDSLDVKQSTIGVETSSFSNMKDFAQTHNIIHLATHGIAYTEEPLNSFVAFSPTETENGLLTAREVAQNRDLPADLVVLSACQTGLGRISGDGMLGLSRAFLIAGARTVVVSQWSVSDNATKELMVAFYQNYLEFKNKAIALQKAMQKVRSGSEYSKPRYWAAFLSVGDYQ